MAYMSKLDIRSLIEGYLFVDICGLPLYRGSGLKYSVYHQLLDFSSLPLYRGSGLKSLFPLNITEFIRLPLYRGSGLK